MMEHVGHFSLWGDFEVDEITKFLGLQPSRVYLKGDVWEGADSPARVSTWDLHCPAGASLNEQVEFLLESLLPKAEALRGLAERFSAEMNLAATLGEGPQVLNLSTGMLQNLAGLYMALNCSTLRMKPKMPI